MFVLAFASLHPFFDAAGLYGLGGCPEPSSSSHEVHGGVSSAACVAAVLAAALTVHARATFFGRRDVHLARDSPTSGLVQPLEDLTKPSVAVDTVTSAARHRTDRKTS